MRIPKGDFVRLWNEANKLLESQGTWGVLFFDRLLTIALLYFVEQRVDYAILEVGVGGRYDPTNFVESPAVTIITSISLDHVDLLGDTLDKIAWQKAGIMKLCVPLVTCDNHAPEVMKVLEDESFRVRCPLYITQTANIDIGPASTPQERENKLLAQGALKVLGIDKPDFSGAYWPGRFEIICPSGEGEHVPMVILDVAHNKDSVSKLLEAVIERQVALIRHVSRCHFLPCFLRDNI